MFRLMVASLGSNRLRSALTVGAVQLAVLLVFVLVAIPAELARFFAELTSESRVVVTHRSGLSYGLPPRLAARLRELPEIEEALGSTYFGGSVEEGGRITFPSMVVDPARVARLYPDYRLPPEQLGVFLRYRDAALVGEQTLRRYGWRIGDRIELASALWGVRLEAEIAGSLPSQPGVWLREDALGEALRARGQDGLPWNSLVWLRIASRSAGGRSEAVGGGEAGAELAQAIGAVGRELGVPLAVQSERAFLGRLLADVQGLAALMRLTSVLVAICISAVAASCLSVGIRDRDRELATLRAIGWSRVRLAALVLGEGALVALAGASAGLLAVVAASAGAQAFRGSEGPVRILAAVPLDLPSAARALAAAGLVGVLMATLPAIGATRRPIAATLRESPA